MLAPLLPLVLGASACTLPFDENVPGCVPVSDDFDDSVRGAFWDPNSFEDPGSSYDETGGELVITLDAGAVSFAGYLSDDDVDMTNRSTTVRLVEGPNAASNAQAFFKIEVPYPNVAMWILEAGQLRARVEIDEDVGDIDMVPYDPARHRFLRLRHRGDTLHWELSEDGSSFTELTSRDGIPVGDVRIGLTAGMYQPEIAPGRARFDDFVAACR